MRSLFAGAVIVSSVCAVGVPARAQGPQAAPANDGHTLRLDVVVTGKGKAPVAGLAAQDFTVLDNRQPAKILAFHAEAGAPPPVPGVTPEVVIVFDDVNAPFERMTYARDEAMKFLRQNGGKLAYPVSLAFSGDDGLQMQTAPTLDGAALAGALAQQEHGMRAVGRGTGVYGAQDRLAISMKALDQIIAQEKTKPNRKMVIWISPGWPLLSAPNINLSQKQMQSVFENAVRLSTALREARITLYSVDPMGAEGGVGQRSGYYQTFVPGLRKTDDAQIGDIGLQVLAEQTGGRAIFGNAMISNSLNDCEQDLSAFYTITIPMAPGDRPNDFHELQVKVDQPKTTARTRNGYYAQP